MFFICCCSASKWIRYISQNAVSDMHMSRCIKFLTHVLNGSNIDLISWKSGLKLVKNVNNAKITICLVVICGLRSIRPGVFCEKGGACNFIKKRLWHRCFPVNFAKFLRTPFFTEHLRWLLLYNYLQIIFRVLLF